MDWILKNKKILCKIKSFFGFDRIKNISRSKKTKILFVGLLLFCIFVPQIASAAWSWTRYLNPVKLLADSTVGLLLTGVQAFMVLLIGIASTIFGAVVDPGNVSGSTGILNQPAIKDIWIMVRDTLNMFFILILLFSAFCTIFQVEKWNLQKLWLSILINALLVNFSFPIARFFIDVSNVAMYYFINNIFGSVTSAGGIFAAFCSGSEISKILFPIDFVQQPLGYELAMIIFTFILAITLLTIATLFAVRLTALAILVMFSPIGFVGYIFPSTSSLADRWWKELFSYAFFGPIMIFILAIALKILEAVGNNKNIFMKNAAGQSGANQATWIAAAAMYSIPIIILWMGMGLGKSMGIAGAEAVIGAGQKFAKWAPWSLAKAAGRKFDRDVMKSWSPRAIITGWQANAKAKEDAHLGGATGAWRDRFNKNRVTGDGIETHYRDMEEEKLKATELKEMEAYATNDDYLIAEIRSLKGKKDAKSQARVAAAVSMMYRNNDQNEFMKKFGIDGGGNGDESERDPIKTREALAKLFRETGMSENQVGRNLYQLGEIGLAKGNYGDYGMGTFDKKTGKYRVADNLKRNKDGELLLNTDGSAIKNENIYEDEQIVAAKAKFVNIGSQEKMKSMHWNSILSEKKEIDKETGQSMTGGIHDAGAELLNSMTVAEADQASRARADFLQRMGKGKGKEALKNFMNSDRCKNPEVIKRLIQSIEDKLNGKDDNKTGKGSTTYEFGPTTETAGSKEADEVLRELHGEKK